MCKNVPHRLELLIERLAASVELEPLLEHHLGPLERAHPEKDRAAPQVALRPVRLQPDALVGVVHRALVLYRGKGGGAVSSRAY